MVLIPFPCGGKTLAWVIEQFGIPMRAAWRRARLRLREALAAQGV